MAVSSFHLIVQNNKQTMHHSFKTVKFVSVLIVLTVDKHSWELKMTNWKIPGINLKISLYSILYQLSGNFPYLRIYMYGDNWQ